MSDDAQNDDAQNKADEKPSVLEELKRRGEFDRYIADQINKQCQADDLDLDKLVREVKEKVNPQMLSAESEWPENG